MRVPDDADRDFTAGCLVVEDGKLLLMKHSKLGMWLQPGGHVEEAETLEETAIRETLEETGIQPEFHPDFVPDTSYEEKSFDLPRPFSVNLHQIRDGHWHYSMLYLATKKSEQDASHFHEHDGIEWFSRQELEELEKIPENVRRAGIEAVKYLLEDF
ncbi:MAG: NUDIX hydrolase [Candidatus Nanohaloarchaea archaeon]